VTDAASRSMHELTRVPTGIPGLDTVLGGGLIQSGIYMLAGQPGAGKTILASQLCFAHVASGGRALFVTLLAESHDRLLEYIQGLSFFDPAPLTEHLYYVSGMEALAADGLDGLLRLLRRELQTHRSSLLIIDGMATAWTSAVDDVAVKHFINELQVFLRAIGCTALLLSQRDEQLARAEYTMVDGIIRLTDDVVDVRAARHLVVQKFRGSAHLRGQHRFEITDDGIVVFPRAEAHFAAPPAFAVEQRVRMPFAISGLDAMLHGGLLSSSATALVGVPGAGKTLLGLHFLAAGAQVGQAGLLFGFYEPPPRVIEKADQVGLDFSAATAQGLVEIVWNPPLEQSLDMLAVNLLDAVARRRVRRLVIDGLNTFQQAALYPQRLGRFFTALFNELRARDVTVLFTVETPDTVGDLIEWPVREATSIAENIVYLRYNEVQGELRRLLSILKVRDSAYDTTMHTFTIGPSGIVIGEILRRGSRQSSAPGDVPTP
jgi:circadian clock protein KaiC